MFVNHLRKPFLFQHNHFLTYMDETTQKIIKDRNHNLSLTTCAFFSSPPPPNKDIFIIIVCFISFSLLCKCFFNNNKNFCPVI